MSDSNTKSNTTEEVTGETRNTFEVSSNRTDLAHSENAVPASDVSLTENTSFHQRISENLENRQREREHETDSPAQPIEQVIEWSLTSLKEVIIKPQFIEVPEINDENAISAEDSPLQQRVIEQKKKSRYIVDSEVPGPSNAKRSPLIEELESDSSEHRRALVRDRRFCVPPNVLPEKESLDEEENPDSRRLMNELLRNTKRIIETKTYMRGTEQPVVSKKKVVFESITNEDEFETEKHGKGQRSKTSNNLTKSKKRSDECAKASTAWEKKVNEKSKLRKEDQTKKKSKINVSKNDKKMKQQEKKSKASQSKKSQQKEIQPIHDQSKKKTKPKTRVPKKAGGSDERVPGPSKKIPEPEEDRPLALPRKISNRGKKRESPKISKFSIGPARPGNKKMSFSISEVEQDGAAQAENQEKGNQELAGTSHSEEAPKVEAEPADKRPNEEERPRDEINVQQPNTESKLEVAAKIDEAVESARNDQRNSQPEKENVPRRSARIIDIMKKRESATSSMSQPNTTARKRKSTAKVASPPKRLKDAATQIPSNGYVANRNGATNLNKIMLNKSTQVRSKIMSLNGSRASRKRKSSKLQKDKPANPSQHPESAENKRKGKKYQVKSQSKCRVSLLSSSSAEPRRSPSKMSQRHRAKKLLKKLATALHLKDVEQESSEVSNSTSKSSSENQNKRQKMGTSSSDETTDKLSSEYLIDSEDSSSESSKSSSDESKANTRKTFKVKKHKRRKVVVTEEATNETTATSDDTNSRGK